MAEMIKTILDEELEESHIEENSMPKRGRKRREETQYDEEGLLGENLSEEKETSKDLEIEQLKRELEESKKKNSSFEKQLKELKKLILTQQQNKASKIEKEEDKFSQYDDSIWIGCHSYTYATLRTSDGRICITFKGREKKLVDVDDLKELFKSNSIQDNRALFERGTFYFANENDEDGYYNDENYSKFKIKKRVDLSKEAIKKILFIQNKNDMIMEIKRISNDLSNRGILHILKHSVVDLFVSGELKNWSFENKQALEEVLRTDFDILMRNLGVFKYLKSKQ